MTAALVADPSHTPRMEYSTLPGSTESSPTATPETLSARGVGFNFEQAAAPLDSVKIVGSTDVTAQVAARVAELRKSISLAPQPAADRLFVQRKVERADSQHAEEYADLSSRLRWIIGAIVAVVAAVIVLVIFFARPKN